MSVFRPSTTDVSRIRDALDALAADEPMLAGQVPLPTVVTQGLEEILRVAATGEPFVVDVGKLVATDERPRCSDCNEPVELADEGDPESWAHAEDAYDLGDHTAWLAGEVPSQRV